MISKYFMDVNIPMYAAGKMHEYKDPCLKILDDIENGIIDVVIDTEIIQEIMYRYHNIGLSEKGIELAGYILDLELTVLPITYSDIILALKCYKQYHKHGIKPRDTIHASVMKNNNLKHILSTDRHFDLIKNIIRIDPKAYR